MNNYENTQSFENGYIFPPFLGFFSKIAFGENTEFSVNMDNIQFYFLKNAYYIKDFKVNLKKFKLVNLLFLDYLTLLFFNYWEDINVFMKI